jgi:hypothetical protein
MLCGMNKKPHVCTARLPGCPNHDREHGREAACEKQLLEMSIGGCHTVQSYLEYRMCTAINLCSDGRKSILTVWFREQDKLSPVVLHGSHAKTFPEPDSQYVLNEQTYPGKPAVSLLQYYLVQSVVERSTAQLVDRYK